MGVAVYQAGRRGEVAELLRDERVDFAIPADYSAGSDLDRVVQATIGRIVTTDGGKSGMAQFDQSEVNMAGWRASVSMTPGGEIEIKQNAGGGGGGGGGSGGDENFNEK